MRPKREVSHALALLALGLVVGAGCKQPKPQADSKAAGLREIEPVPQVGALVPGAVAPAGPVAESPPRNASEAVKSQSAGVRVPAGSPIRVRLDTSLSTKTNTPGDRFTGSLTSPVVVRGVPVVPAGARVSGVVTSSKPSGRLKGRAVLAIRADRVEWGGQSYRIRTTSYSRASSGHKKRNWSMIGGGTGVGALIGGLTGGGKGAAIGAGAGAAAGTAGAAITGKRQVSLPAETVVTFKTRQSFTVGTGQGATERTPS